MLTLSRTGGLLRLKIAGMVINNQCKQDREKTRPLCAVICHLIPFSGKGGYICERMTWGGGDEVGEKGELRVKWNT